MTRPVFSFTFVTILFFLTGQITYGQDGSIKYSNDANAYYSRKAQQRDTFFASKINEITLNLNSTFQFWSRPHASCFTWHHYDGTWKKDKDSLFFFDNYQVEERDTRVKYKKGPRQEFVISFKTDKNSALKNRSIKIQYEYDFDAHIDSREKIFHLNAGNAVIIPYKDIPNLHKLASIRIEYLLNYTEKRYHFLTESNTVNIKQGDIPNIIKVEFIERPQKEIVYRTIRAVVKNDKLMIVSSSKTKTILSDYRGEIEFENSYTSDK
jgi:hypothetical protein